MKKELFNELVDSIKEAGAIRLGKKRASREHDMTPIDVQSVRNKYGFSQVKFAGLLGISVGTLRNWEQGRRKPGGSARVLLKVVARHPETVLDAVNY